MSSELVLGDVSLSNPPVRETIQQRQDAKIFFVCSEEMGELSERGAIHLLLNNPALLLTDFFPYCIPPVEKVAAINYGEW